MALSYFDRLSGRGHSLWVTDSDGTSLGRKLVASFGGGAISNFTTIGSRVFFAVNDGTRGQELWTSDGTAAGTVLLSDINPGSNGSFPSNLTNVNGTLYFDASAVTHGFELWKSDGTVAGTLRVKDIAAGPAGSSPTPNDLTNVSGTLYFSADDGAHGPEIMEIGRDRLSSDAKCNPRRH
jgi:ELWxxDGT repeat protein